MHTFKHHLEWLNIDRSLSMSLFYKDRLHLIKNGNELLAKEILCSYKSLKTKPHNSSIRSFKDVTLFSLKDSEFPPLLSGHSTSNHLMLKKQSHPKTRILSTNKPLMPACLYVNTHVSTSRAYMLPTSTDNVFVHNAKPCIKSSHIRSTTSSLLDHILTNAGWKISQKGVIDVGLSDHQLIYCTRKIIRTIPNMHNQIRVRSLKKYTSELLIKELKKINFPKYNIFSNVNIAYLDLVGKILSQVDKIAPFKDLRIKNSTQDWFDDEFAKAIKLREKHLKQFKSTKLHIDEDLYKEAKYHAVKLIKQKKSRFYKEKLKENIGKPKELWKALKSLGLPSKKGTISNICLKKDDKICFDDNTNANTFKEFFCNLASDLVAK